ncbi:UDP diphosphate synthase [candidate division MSBL1 archaeon SCGC-AAA259I09]|uniref:Tritrans,polycis-undecaprenyl-diphosphate synthase (geranylgeranyl-diphosphate specific) n=3 Tax=candidate division MSBL1 TaxID=215777 RepID=A0A133UVV1_9EURY|nr:UDP diphosphate synthase [candidate division MSBL1 archaeon SCGC-AAA259E22]KXA98317.1 UDP diphosphate synthase [candidate division MSBL1 archaeon SCGC-AAA259I09]
MVSNYYENRLFRRIKKRGNLPNHIGIILDGNRRYASEREMILDRGHILGAKKLEQVLDWARELGIQYITVYAFSKENFDRSKEEIETLMKLFESKFNEIIGDNRVDKHEIRVNAVGDMDSLPPEVVSAIRRAEEATKEYDNYFLNIAIGYSGRQELVNAVRKICKSVKDDELDIEDINKDVIEENLYTADLPDPDLIIRTSGEERLSGFLLWQSAYSELYFCEAYWPEFDKINFFQAVSNFQERERRYGR